MLWPGIKYPMYSFQSKTDSIISILRPVEARIYICFKIMFYSNESPGEKNVVIHDLKKRYMLWPRIKYPKYSFQSKSVRLYLFPDVLKLEYIYISRLISIGTNPQKKKRCYSRYQRRVICCGQE
jgi:hypothetical protein